MHGFAWMVRRHEDGILNYFRMPIDNGTVKELNNKAKLVIHNAYGFRTATNYSRISTTAWPIPLYPYTAYIRVRNRKRSSQKAEFLRPRVFLDT